MRRLPKPSGSKTTIPTKESVKAKLWHVMKALKELSNNQRVAIVISGTYVFWVLGMLFVANDHLLWDFKVYSSAATAYHLGLNPYHLDGSLQPHQNVASLPFMYPPLALYYYVPFAWLPSGLAIPVFSSIKFLALCGLFFVWDKIVPLQKHAPVFLMFSFFAFNAALHRDLISGNISVFEQLLLWIGIYYFIEGKIWHFGYLIVLVSTVKLLPIVFLGFLLLSDKRGKYKAVIWFLALFIFYLGLNYVLEPTLTPIYVESFVSANVNSIASNDHNAGGINNASTYEFMKALPTMLSVDFSGTLPVVLYILLAIGVTLITWQSLRPIMYSTERDHKLMLVFTLSMLVLLILPRVKDYSYILAVLPTFYIVVRNRLRDSLLVLLVLICLSARDLKAPIFSEMLLYYWDFYTLVLSGVVWGLYIKEVREVGAPKNSEPESLVGLV